MNIKKTLDSTQQYYITVKKNSTALTEINAMEKRRVVMKPY